MFGNAGSTLLWRGKLWSDSVNYLKLLHAGYIFHKVHFGAGSGNTAEEMEEQVIACVGAVDIGDGGNI
jgi:hypothetical protein